MSIYTSWLIPALTCFALVGCTTSADKTAPTVTSFTSSSSTVTTTSSITLTATATDDVAVTEVKFYDGTMSIGTATTIPYTLTRSYTSADNGTKSYTAKAYDAAGNVATSIPVSVTVNIPVAP